MIPCIPRWLQDPKTLNMLKKAMATDIYQHQLLPLSPDIDSAVLFSHFAGQPWSLMLDSANSTHPDARFDIIYANPVATLSYGNQKLCLTVEDAAKGLVSAGIEDAPPFAAAQQLLDDLGLPQASLPWQQGSSGLPSGIGLAGYFGYDLGRTLEVLPDDTQALVELPDMAVAFYSWAIIKDNRQGQWHLVWDSRFAAPTTDDLLQWGRRAMSNSDFSLTSDWQARTAKTQYAADLNRIHDYLLAGDCYQVNYAQGFSANYRGDPWGAYLALRADNQAPFSSFMRLDNGAVLSISPERFLQVKDGLVETKPIKGTMPRDTDAKRDADNKLALSQSEKDRAENLMIVDLLRNDVSKHATPGSVKVPKLFEIESFPAVHHLVSTVTATLSEDSHPLDMLAGAFPGGSITGAPKIRAMEIIEELEPIKRHIYCGSIGYSGIGGDMDTNIAIRSLVAQNGKIHCWAGGGIVADSTAEAEYQESLDKVSRILPLLRTLNGTD